MAKTPRFATATCAHSYSGAPLPCFLTSFKTKRLGETVTRYRWQSETGEQVHRWAAPFSSIDAAIRAAEAHGLFSDIQRALL